MSKSPAIIKDRHGTNFGQGDWQQDRVPKDVGRVNSKQNYDKNYESAIVDDGKVKDRLVEERRGGKIVVKSKLGVRREQTGGGRCAVGTTSTGKRPTFISKEEENERWAKIDWSN